MTAPVLEAALEALACGLCPIPTAQDGSKRPAGLWRQWQHNLPTEAQVRQWFSNGQEGVGLVTGTISRDLELYELEGQAVRDGIDTQLDTMAEAIGIGDLWGRVIEGYVESTPAGGMHVLYHCPGGVGPPQKLARRPSTPEELVIAPEEPTKLLIETKGQHGYCIIAPSRGPTHPNGGAWVRLSGGLRSIATITIDERAQLFDLARLFDRPNVVAAPTVPMLGERIVTPGGTETTPSEEFMAANTCGQVLERAGFTTSNRTVPGGRLYTRPGKATNAGHSAIVRDHHQRTGDERAAIYSTSVAIPPAFLSPGPDGQERALNSWQTHVALNHGGRFGEAATAWRAAHPRPRVDPTGWIEAKATKVTPPPHVPQVPTGAAAAPMTALELLTAGSGHTEAPAPPGRMDQHPPGGANLEPTALAPGPTLEPVDLPTRLRRWSAAELAGADLTITWLVRGLLTQPTYGMAAGALKTLKTHATTLLAVSIASGIPYLGEFEVDRPGPVLIYVGEGGRIPYTRLLQRCCQALGVNLADLPIHVIFEAAPVTSEVFVTTLETDLAELRPVFVLIDPWYAYHGSGSDGRNLFDEGALLAGLQARVALSGAVLIIVNHFNQTGEGAGLKRITMAGGGEWVDTWLLLTHRIDPDVDAGLFRLNLTVGSRQWGGSSWELDLSTGRFDPDLGHHDGPLAWDLRRATGGGSEADQATQAILEAVEEAEVAGTVGAGKEELAKAAGVGLQAARRLVDTMTSKGLLDVRRTNVLRADGKAYPAWRYYTPPPVEKPVE